MAKYPKGIGAIALAVAIVVLTACGGAEDGGSTEGGGRDFHDATVLEASLRAKTNFTVKDVSCPQKIEGDEVVCAAPGQSNVALNVVIQDEGRRYVATATRNAGTVEDTLSGAAAALLSERFDDAVDDTPYSDSGFIAVQKETGEQEQFQLPLIPEQTLLDRAEGQEALGVTFYERDKDAPPSLEEFLARPPVAFLVYQTVQEATKAKQAWRAEAAYGALERRDAQPVVAAIRKAGGVPEPKQGAYALALFYAPVDDDQEKAVQRALDDVGKLKK